MQAGVASFPGPAQLSVAILVLQATKSWAGPGNKTRLVSEQ